MDLMYDLKMAVAGQDVATTLSYKDVIFVMEDVDAASKVVHRRVEKSDVATTSKTTVELTRTDAAGAQQVERVTRETSTNEPEAGRTRRRWRSCCAQRAAPRARRPPSSTRSQ